MTLSNDSPWVTIDVSPAIGNVWRCKHIRHLPGVENQGKRNVFVKVYHAGELVRDGSVRIVWGWKGQHSDEIAKPAICDKKGVDYSTDIPIDKDQEIWCSVDDGKNIPSDVVRGIWSGMPSDGPGNSEWHNSTEVTFEMIIALPPVQPPVTGQPPTMPTSGAWQEDRVAKLEAQMELVLASIQVKLPPEAKG